MATSDTTKCINCKEEFLKTNTGYNRHSAQLVCSWDTYSEIFGPELTQEVFEKSFLCSTCRIFITSNTTPDKKYGSKRAIPQTDTIKSKKSKSNFKCSAKKALDESRYEKAFRTLIRGSKRARQAFKKVCLSLVHEEVRIYILLLIQYN